MTKTIQKAEGKSDFLVYPYSSLDDDTFIQFEIKGLTVERSYEDRDVYLNIKGGTITDEGSVRPSVSDIDATMWLRGEDAIDMGMKLIEHGRFALESNMINHQAIHIWNNYEKFLLEDRVEEVVFEMIDDKPVNHGDGFRTFKITPIWNEGMEPEYQKDFSFEKVIYWSPFENEYADQLDRYTRGCSYSFEGYDHDAEVRTFNESVRLMSGNDV